MIINANNCIKNNVKSIEGQTISREVGSNLNIYTK